MELLEFTARCTRTKPTAIFYDAYIYSELSIPHKVIAQHYRYWTETGFIPYYVYDYCLDLLAGRCQPLYWKGEIDDRKR